MVNFRNNVAVVLCSITTILAAALPTLYAHNGGILVQAQGDRLVTGLDDESGGTQTVGVRAFSLLFPSSLANDIPSFLSLKNAPGGSDPLPVGGQLYWDFLPMTHEGFTSNLLYWDGQGTAGSDVEFGPLPQGDINFSLYTQNFTDVAHVEGTATMVPGKLIGTITSNTVALHAHRWFYLGTDTTESSVPEGIYLAALQLRMEGYTATDPFYIAAATDEISASILDNLALPWVAERVDSLIRPGDFDRNGVVDGGDFLLWQREVGSSGAQPSSDADGNYDGVVDAGDLAVWQTHYPVPAAHEVAAASVPEPTVALLITCGGFALATFRPLARETRRRR